VKILFSLVKNINFNQQLTLTTMGSNTITCDQSRNGPSISKLSPRKSAKCTQSRKRSRNSLLNLYCYCSFFTVTIDYVLFTYNFWRSKPTGIKLRTFFLHALFSFASVDWFVVYLFEKLGSLCFIFSQKITVDSMFRWRDVNFRW